MRRLIVPAINKPRARVNKVALGDWLVIGTTAGLVKKNNEDRVGYLVSGSLTRICVADGHWGEEAAQIIAEHWLKPSLNFPVSKRTAVLETKSVENKIYKTFRRPVMDSEKDFTPEASFVAIQISQNDVSIVSYGDCRILATKDGKIVYEQPTTPTWLGVFSHSGIRDRLSVEKATIYKDLPLENGSAILIYTDGIDECIYEKPSISDNTLAGITNQDGSEAVFDSILREVFTFGAEDNASLAVVKI